MMEIDQIYEGDCLTLMPEIADNIIDLTITSPPYDNLRKYNGYTFDFEGIAKELFRVTKPGGVVVWVVGDATIDGSETGTSFKQALHFKEIGFKLHDTMIYNKGSTGGAKGNIYAYWQGFEYMFVFSKGRPTTTNFIKDKPNKYHSDKPKFAGKRLPNGETTGRVVKNIGEFGRRTNVWSIPSGFKISTTDNIAFEHPAIFPEQLASDHILSWSNPGDLILDPMCGSGTTCKMAKYHDRRFIGIEISGEYVAIAKARIASIPARLDRWLQ
jgi:DNA modification methylase